MLKSTIVATGRTTSLPSPEKMQIPHMGPEQSEDDNSEPHQEHKRSNTNQGDQINDYNQNFTWWFHIIRDLVKALRKHARSLGYKCILREDRPSKTSLWPQKTKILFSKKSGVIYRYKCDREGCEEQYIGESARAFAERFKEHQKAPSPIFDHCNILGHNITIDNFSIVGREDQNLIRTIKEALYIRVNDPSLNRKIGKYHLPHIWDEVLLKTPELKLKH